VNFSQNNFSIPVAPSEEEQKDKMINLEVSKEKKSDEASSFSKFWNWATQLF
jgi:cell division protein FtsA